MPFLTELDGLGRRTGRQGQASMNHHTVVNAVGLSRNMDPILDLFDAAVLGLQEEFDSTIEAKFELQSIIELISGQSDSADGY